MASLIPDMKTLDYGFVERLSHAFFLTLMRTVNLDGAIESTLTIYGEDSQK